MDWIKVPMRYLPKALNKKDRSTQSKQLAKSRRLYKKGKFYTRKRVASFVSKPSGHVQNARKIYGVDTMTPNKELSRATGCSVSTLKKIVSKGEGAYFSSGSRPNQTAQSWGLARLASSLTGGKAAAVDFDILDKGCDHKKKAFRMAKTAKRKYGKGHSGAKKIIIL
jgi:DNA-binding Xre family transcriptional regulator